MAQSARIDELRKRYEENQRRFFAPLANEYRKAGDLEQAIALCQLHLVDAPSNLSGQIVFGQALFDAGNLDESRGAFETAIGLDPENLIALRHLGDIARTQEDAPRAREWYQRVLDADPRNDDVIALMQALAAVPAAAPAASAAETPPRATMSAPPLIEVNAPPAPAPALEPEPAPTYAPPPPSSYEARTLEIVAMPMHAPVDAAPSAAEAAPEVAPEPVPQAEPDFPEPDFEGFPAGEHGAPAADHHAAEESTPASSFGFDVDLDAAESIPVVDVGADERTSDFGEVELPRASSFSDMPVVAEPSPFASLAAAPEPMSEPVPEPPPEPEYAEAPVHNHEAEPEPEPDPLPPVEAFAPDAPAAELLEVADDVIVAQVPADLPNILEYTDELPSLPVVSPQMASFPEFELDVPPPPPRSPTPSALNAFELTTLVGAHVPRAEPEAPPVPDDTRAASFESFDPIREMPTPVAPIAPAISGTPRESMRAVLESPDRESDEASAPPLAVAYTPQHVAEAEAIAQADPPAETAVAPEVFATETMAELYVSQGLRQEAIAVYTQLIESRPHDAALQTRLQELEAGRPRRGTPSTARAFFANLAGRRATPMRDMEAVPSGGVAVAEPPMQSTDAIADDAPASAPSVAEDMPAFASDANVAAADAVFALKDGNDGAADGPVAAPGGTLDALFGHSDASAPDTSAAQALAAAFANAPQPMPGRPTRAASDEVSLDRVFREGTSTPSRGGLTVPRQSSSLRFDQFFAPSADPSAPQPPAAPASEPAGESEQFQAWLSGLKKP